jgi:hypothetical protein
MKHVLILSMFLSVSPALAEDDSDRGRDLMTEALRLFMQGFMAEMEPAIDDLQGFVEDLNAYHAPEILPNGDIIIRRKSAEELGDPGGDVEL